MAATSVTITSDPVGFVSGSVNASMGDLTGFVINQFNSALWLRNLINLVVVGLLAHYVVFPLLRDYVPDANAVIPK